MGLVDSISKSFQGDISSVEKKPLVPAARNLLQESQTNTLDQQPEKVHEKDIKEKDLETVVNDLNHVLGNTHTSLKYEYHEKLHEYYVTLVDDKTDEMVREIPPKKLLDIYASMKEYLGLFVDNKI